MDIQINHHHRHCHRHHHHHHQDHSKSIKHSLRARQYFQHFTYKSHSVTRAPTWRYTSGTEVLTSWPRPPYLRQHLSPGGVTPEPVHFTPTLLPEWSEYVSTMKCRVTEVPLGVSPQTWGSHPRPGGQERPGRCWRSLWAKSHISYQREGWLGTLGLKEMDVTAVLLLSFLLSLPFETTLLGPMLKHWCSH